MLSSVHFEFAFTVVPSFFKGVIFMITLLNFNETFIMFSTTMAACLQVQFRKSTRHPEGVCGLAHRKQQIFVQIRDYLCEHLWVRARTHKYTFCIRTHNPDSLHVDVLGLVRINLRYTIYSFNAGTAASIFYSFIKTDC